MMLKIKLRILSLSHVSPGSIDSITSIWNDFINSMNGYKIMTHHSFSYYFMIFILLFLYQYQFFFGCYCAILEYYQIACFNICETDIRSVFYSLNSTTTKMILNFLRLYSQ